MATVIDTVSADTIQDGDTIQFQHKGSLFTIDVKGEPVDTGQKVTVKGYSHETGDNVTVKFRPDQRVDILGS